MAEFKKLDIVAFNRAAKRGQQAYATPRAISARFDRRTHRVIVKLDAGIDFAFDPKLAPGLGDATADDLVGVSVEGVGSTLHFPRLDADFTVSRLLEGFLGPMDWTRREARALASRENGKRGGRPVRKRGDTEEVEAAPKGRRYEVYRDAAGTFRFRFVFNGVAVDSVEAYVSEALAQAAVATVEKGGPSAPAHPLHSTSMLS